MAYPVAAGVPQLSGTYIPNLFAGKLLQWFYTRTVFGEISNTDYEGQIRRYGDKVTIRTLPDVDINAYVKGQDLTYTYLEPSSLDLLIDQGFSWSFPINAVDVAQADIAGFANMWADHASRILKIKVDQTILANAYSAAHARNTGATAGAVSYSYNLGAASAPVTTNYSNMMANIINCGAALDEQDCPEDGRWIIIPAWAVGQLKQSDLKSVYITGDRVSPLRSGYIGQTINGFSVYMSNNLAYTVESGVRCYHCIFGHKIGLTFAGQFTEREIIPNPKDFGQLFRGLFVYGYKVVKPEAIGHLYIKSGTPG